jgi:hypothetical protein
VGVCVQELQADNEQMAKLLRELRADRDARNDNAESLHTEVAGAPFTFAPPQRFTNERGYVG